MLWFVGGAVVLGVPVLGAGLWLLAPTLRSLFGPDFEPTSTNDAAVFEAQQSSTIGGGGVGL